jgi:hypothetical protein
MLDKVARTAEARDALLTFAQARADIDSDPEANVPLATLLGWVETYLMREHPDLGRTGAVCPFRPHGSTPRDSLSAAPGPPTRSVPSP